MNDAQWAWLWHYHFIHLIDQQQAFECDGKKDEAFEVANVISMTLKQDDRLFEILLNARLSEIN